MLHSSPLCPSSAVSVSSTALSWRSSRGTWPSLRGARSPAATLGTTGTKQSSGLSSRNITHFHIMIHDNNLVGIPLHDSQCSTFSSHNVLHINMCHTFLINSVIKTLLSPGTFSVMYEKRLKKGIFFLGCYPDKTHEATPHLVALISLIGGPSRRVGEDVGLGMLTRPELLLSCLQQHGGLHHILLILVFIETSPHQAGIEPVFVSITGKHKQQLNILTHTTDLRWITTIMKQH